MNPGAANRRLSFDVFGIPMRVERYDGRWHLLRVSEDGKSSLIRDISIPPELTESELGRYLDDMYHELATSDHPDVKQLD